MEKNQVIVELFYTLICPNCKILQRMLDDALTRYGDKFVIKKIIANVPITVYTKKENQVRVAVIHVQNA